MSDWTAEGRKRPKRRWWAVAARPMAQMPLDLVQTPGAQIAAVAYGLRPLRANYNGPAINVLRSSDSATMDIGFRGSDLDVQTCSNFIGGSVGHVNIWYDQSSNGLNLVNQGSTTPIINLTGAGGRPTAVFAATDNMHHGSTPTSVQPFTISAVAARTGAFTAYGGLAGDDGSSVGLYFNNVANGTAMYGGTGLVTGPAETDNVIHSFFAVFNGATSAITVDGATMGGLAPGTNGYGGVRVGNVGTFGLVANVSEIVFWNVVLSASDIANLSANQLAYY